MAYTKRGLYVVCQVEGCNRKHSTKGWCHGHAERVRLHGSPGGLLKERSGRSVTARGYVRIGSIFEHRIVMEQVLGRPLLPAESVHHINGVRDDNRPENLELWSKSQPSGQRVADKVAWAIELLQQYSPASLNPEQRSNAQ